MNKYFKSRFKWVNMLVCKLVGCAMTHISAMAFEDGTREPVEILIICPRCGQPHCHEWPEETQSIDLDGVGVDFYPEFSVDRKTLN